MTSIYKQRITKNLLSDILSVSKKTISVWSKNGFITPDKDGVYSIEALQHIPKISKIVNSKWDEELSIRPLRKYTSIELFAGAGGLAMGLEKAGFENIALNEFDKQACSTLRRNRKNWNIIEDDIKNIDLSLFSNIDLLSAGFPCQAFSYAGKKLGFEDTRGTLFFNVAKTINETKPKVFFGENVKGLLTHDKGKTLKTIKSIICELGYTVIDSQVLKAIFYQVPQKRERLFLVCVRNDLMRYAKFSFPEPYKRVMVLSDALKKGELYDKYCPTSEGQVYPRRKKEILELVPEGGHWANLPENIQKEYMQSSFFMDGGKTGIARRLSYEEPSLTLTCSPAQKQTERCHPVETKPLTIREYARVQTFPDSWIFEGSVSSQYKQIGNAVPVNLAYAVGRKLIDLLNNIQKQKLTSSKSLLLKNKESYILTSGR